MRRERWLFGNETSSGEIMKLGATLQAKSFCCSGSTLLSNTARRS